MPITIALAAIAMGITMAPPAQADRLYLTGGGVLEGHVIEQTTHALRLESFGGSLEVPAGVIARRVTEQSRYEQYQERTRHDPIDAAGQVELARWCLDRGLVRLARRHVAEALTLDPARPDARRLDGYIWVGGAWLKAGTGIPDISRETQILDQRILDQLTSAHFRRIRTIRDTLSVTGDTTNSRSFARGRLQLLGIKSALAVPAACAVFGGDDRNTRILLTEFLGGFEQDVARLNLLALALTDPDGEVRLAASRQLASRPDPRLVTLFQAALRCRTDAVVRRAGTTLGVLNDPRVAEDLILALPTRAFAGQQRTLADIVNDVRRTLDKPITIPIDDRTLSIAPPIAIPDFVRRVEAIDADTTPVLGRFRSEIQDALTAISGENLGFDAQAWRNWFADHPDRDTGPSRNP